MASAKGERLLNVFMSLEAHPLIGISNKEIAERLNIKPVDVSRDLKDLVDTGLVQKLDNGNYSYSIKTLQIAERFRRDQQRIKERLSEIEKWLY